MGNSLSYQSLNSEKESDENNINRIKAKFN